MGTIRIAVDEEMACLSTYTIVHVRTEITIFYLSAIAIPSTDFLNILPSVSSCSAIQTRLSC